MSEKKEKTLWIIICALVVLIGGVFTLYSAKTLNKNNVFAKEARDALKGKVDLIGESAFKTKDIGFDIYPGYKGIQMFVIRPLEDGDGIYELKLKASVPNELLNHLKVTLYRTGDTGNNYLYRNEEVTLVDDVVVSKNDVLTFEGELERLYEGELKNGTISLDKVKFNVNENVFTNPVITPDGEYTYYLVYEYMEDETFNNQDYDFETEVLLEHVFS